MPAGQVAEACGRDGCSRSGLASVPRESRGPRRGGHRYLRRGFLGSLPPQKGLALLLIAAALFLHVAGRAVALRSLYLYDTFYYSVAAYRFWQPGATPADLIPDKPIGQPLLTGWVFRTPGAPASRMALVPVESAFMLAGYAVFFVTARRLFGLTLAAALTVFFVIAHNSYNALNSITDGFNLAECYLILPCWLAVLAHTTMTGTRRGLLRGLGLGLALAIKQTAAGLMLVLLLHGLARAIRQRRWVSGLNGLLLSLLGIAAVWLPIVLVLHGRGWLGVHVESLVRLSGQHTGANAWRLPDVARLIPILPLLWWIVLGLLALACTGLVRPVFSPVVAAKGRVAPPPRADWPVGRRSLCAMAAAWLVIEAAIIATLRIPATHYWQQLVGPLGLLAGLGVSALLNRTLAMTEARHAAVVRWMAASTLMLALAAAGPLLAAMPGALKRIDPAAERAQFADWLATWSPSSAADHLLNRASTNPEE